MIFRTAFVSNSSSSSFMIAVKGISNREVRDRIVKKIFRVPEDSPLYDLAEDAARVYAYQNVVETYETQQDIDKYEKGCWNKSRIPEYRDLIKRGFEINIGSLTNDMSCGDIECDLVHSKIDYEDPELVLKADGHTD